ncbi:MAG: FAD-dependent thymidylate synthase [Patescibacteria group bacterium]|nr:FAD-dependent thymidylate synthase [Patescibacteria group bacterium]
MNNNPRIYALKNLSPEVIAVAFAKCSRSPESFDKIATELTEKQSADFNEKWVVNFGHGSIAEHAFLNIAIENISLMAVECIQSNRLGSYTEKSSRYQIYDRGRIYVPKIFDSEPKIKQAYLNAVNQLFDVYEKSIEPIKQAIYKIYPNVNNDPEHIWQAKIKSKWIDICRFLLPNCVLANLGASMNARSWEYAIVKMLSHPLAEVGKIGQEVKKVALEITPTLVKYANPNEYYILNEQFLHNKAKDLAQKLETPEFNNDNKLQVELIDYDKQGEDKILAALLYKYRPTSFNQALNKIKTMSKAEKGQIFKTILEKAKNIYDKPPRELEYPYYTFDVLLDQGAYYDLKRNRIMTQTPQILNGEYGYYTPQIFTQVGLADDYRNAMEQAHQTCRLIAEKYPYEAQYITTKATARRFIMKMNLREAFYFIGLRSKKTGHFMYRKVAQMVYDHIARVHPMLAKYIMVDKE